MNVTEVTSVLSTNQTCIGLKNITSNLNGTANKTFLDVFGLNGTATNCTLSGVPSLNSHSDVLPMTTLIFIVLEILLMVWIGGVNTMVIVAVSKFPNLQTTTNIFLVNLSLADLLVATGSLPLHVILYIWQPLKRVFILCMLRYCILVISCGSSTIFLLMTALERFVGIMLPLWHKVHVTKKRCIIVGVVIWCYTTGYAMSPISGWNTWYPGIECGFLEVLPATFIYIVIGHIYIIVLMLFAIYSCILCKITRRSSNPIGYSSSNDGTSHKKTDNIRVVKTLVTVVILFALFLLPFCIVSQIELAFKAAGKTSAILPTLRVITTLISLCNSGINPVIYHRKLKPFREAFLKLLGRDTSPVPRSAEINKITGTNVYKDNRHGANGSSLEIVDKHI